MATTKKDVEIEAKAKSFLSGLTWDEFIKDASIVIGAAGLGATELWGSKGVQVKNVLDDLLALLVAIPVGGHVVAAVSVRIAKAKAKLGLK